VYVYACMCVLKPNQQLFAVIDENLQCVCVRVCVCVCVCVRMCQNFRKRKGDHDVSTVWKRKTRVHLRVVEHVELLGGLLARLLKNHLLAT
jgi:hypothetical protein